MLDSLRRVALFGATFTAFACPPELIAQDSRATSRPASRATASQPSDGDSEAEGEQRGKRGEKKPKKKKKKEGLAVAHELIEQRCSACHQKDDRGHMGRISYMRKSPEGWSKSIKRMIRLYGVSLTPTEAKDMVRYLANDHGLTRSEAERSLYESERRVHWSEEHHDDDLKRACSQCHTLGRVFGQQRDAEEWRLLRATHLAYYPISRGQIGGMPRRPSSSRGSGEMPPWMAAQFSSSRGSSSSSRGRGSSERPSRSSRGDRGDRVLDKLAKDQPLFSKEWKAWEINRREVPLAGRWTVTGHEIGRGDVLGTVVMKRVSGDEFETHWSLDFENGDHVERSGKGLLYAGYSWRGSTTHEGTKWREVLLLDEQWRHFKGRVFTGEYFEIGLDVELHRQTGEPNVVAIRNRDVMIPSKGHVLEVHGEGFTPAMQPSDFHLGRHIEVKSYEFVSHRHVRLGVDVSRKAKRGERTLEWGLFRGSKSIVLYDTVDYVTITPVQGLARIGGVASPKQFERFEAVAMNRGPDDKSYTDDDYQVRVVPNVKWSLAEFRVRDDDDDLQYVGKIDESTGFFTPAIDGPNPKRKWMANNIGDVYVVCETEFEVQKLPEKKKEKEDTDEKDITASAAEATTSGGDVVTVSTESSGERRRGGRRERFANMSEEEREEMRRRFRERRGSGGGGGSGRGRRAATETSEQKPAEADAKAETVAKKTEVDENAPVVMETKKFKARAHLIVTVPKYKRFEVLDWKDE